MASKVAVAISLMLMGTIGFQMVLYYLVNWDDRDIKKYSWQVISQTISIFCAVLLFQAINGLLEKHVMEGLSEEWEIIVSQLQLLGWLSALQIVLAITSGAMNEKFSQVFRREIRAPELEEVELRVKSYAELLSHLSGFAAINALGSLQQNVFEATPGRALLVVPIGLVGLLGVYKVFHLGRKVIALADDDLNELEKKWIEETSECENDIAGLCLSFLTVQALRFKIGGVLPNVEGIEEEGDSAWSHGGAQWKILVGLGAVFFVGALVTVSARERYKRHLAHLEHHEQHHSPKKQLKAEHEEGKKKTQKHEEKEEEGEESEEEEEESMVVRLLEIGDNYFAFAFAWCCFFGYKWGLSALGVSKNLSLIAVTLALLLSFGSFLFIFVLDAMMDRKMLGESEEAVGSAETLVTALGILIGFSWEQCFDTAVAEIADKQADRMDPAVSKCIMSVVLVLLVFPAWRFYILPTQISLSTADTMAKARLMAAADFHMEKFLSPDSSEAHLDDMHMQMKQHRRTAFKIRNVEAPPKLKRLRVTAKGVSEIQEGDDGSHHVHKKVARIREDELTKDKLFHNHISSVTGVRIPTKRASKS